MVEEKHRFLLICSFGLLLLTTILVNDKALACDSHDKNCLPQIDDREDGQQPTVAELREGIESKHPYNFCELSKAYFTAGDNAQALKFFYVCQLRWRVYLQTEADQTPGGEAAAFGAFNFVMQRPVFMVGKSDMDQWVEQVLAAIDWHKSNPSLFQDFSKFPEDEASVIAQLEKLVVEIRAQQDK